MPPLKNLARRRGGALQEHEFTLVLTGVSELTEAVENALFESCADATLAMRSGRPFLTFSRAAPTIKDAILSAIADVRKARIGADVLRVDHSDLVSPAEIARKLGKSRQMVHQYMTGARGPGEFPPPVCHIGDEQALWSWCEVASWLSRHRIVEKNVLRDAEEIDVINSVLDFERQKKSHKLLTKEVLNSVAS